MSDSSLAIETLELGETLFDAMIDALSSPPEGEEQMPIDDLRSAADEFFATLRELLHLHLGEGQQ